MLSQGASKVNISLVIPMKDKDRLIKSLHACFFEGKKPEDL
jgi:aspartokinase